MKRISEKQLKRRYPNIYVSLQDRVNAMVVSEGDDKHKVKWLNMLSYFGQQKYNDGTYGDTLTFFELIK